MAKLSGQKTGYGNPQMGSTKTMLGLPYLLLSAKSTYSSVRALCSASRSQSSDAKAAPRALTHLTSAGEAHMVPIGGKPISSRTAIAVGTVAFSNGLPLQLIRDNAVRKGDVLSIARIAGIMAAKRTPDLIPLCHPVALSSVSIELELGEPGSSSSTMKSLRDTSSGNFGNIHIKAKVDCEGKTGVEMEALTAVMGTALTVVDMCKGVDRGMRIDGVRVVRKTGGTSGEWVERGFREVGPEGTGK